MSAKERWEISSNPDGVGSEFRGLRGTGGMVIKVKM